MLAVQLEMTTAILITCNLPGKLHAPDTNPMKVRSLFLGVGGLGVWGLIESRGLGINGFRRLMLGQEARPSLLW